MASNPHQPIQFTRKAIRLGKGSLCVTIPQEIVDRLNIREKQKLTLELDGEQIVVKDWEE
jgi:antitoxin component of MazEF toxin-antitoxin module